MSREYEVFVESLRQSLMERLGLNEKQIYFEERDENGMTPNGDRLFVECNASSVGKEVCGIHTEELFEDYEDGVSLEQIAKTVESEIRKLKTAGFFEKTKNLNNYEKVKNDLFIRALNVERHERELSKAVYRVVGDIALVLYMQVGNLDGRISSMKIRMDNIKEWGKDEKTVFDAALLNTYFISPPRIFYWEKLVYNPDYDGECFMDLNHEFYLTRDSIGSCLSTARRTNGAVAIFLPGVAKRLADLMDADFYMVFTSIHEVMIHNADHSYPEDLENVFKRSMEVLGGKIDFVLHSIGMSPNVRKKRPYDDLDYDMLSKTLDISAVSFHKMIQVAKKMDAINEYGSILALSYVAAQRTLFGYNDMADAKALLESIARSFGYIYGREKNVRINTISQSPTMTTAGSGVKGMESLMDFANRMSPLGNANADECADYCIVMFSDLTRKVTMQNLYHDGGFSSMGMSLRAMTQYNKSFDEYRNENGEICYG